MLDVPLSAYYEDAAVTLYHGDCREILPQLEAVDHVITDPPYSEHTHRKQWVGAALTKGRARFSGPGLKTELGFPSLDADTRRLIATESARLVRRWVAVFSDIEGCDLWRVDLTASGLEYVRTCVWVKPDAAPQFTGDRPGSGAEVFTLAHQPGRKRWSGGGRHGVFSHMVNNYGRTDRQHPTAKPETLMSELVTLFTDAGDLILDPFGGSGTTAVAAKRLGRRCILIDREEKYCEVAAKRLSQGALELFGADQVAAPSTRRSRGGMFADQEIA